MNNINNIIERGTFSSKFSHLLNFAISEYKKTNTVKFIDLFAGLGGIRIGFESAFNKMGLKTQCVFTSEKKHAIKAYSENFNNEKIYGDISKIKSSEIPNVSRISLPTIFFCWK